MNTYLCGSPSNDEHVVELLRRAIVQSDQDARVGVQQCLSRVVREQRLAYLLFHCGLQPGEIVRCSREFSDLYEIYRLRHNIMERFLCNLNHLRL